MRAIALAVALAVAGVSVWAWRRAPAGKAAEEFIDIWRKPWGKQFYADFFGLQVVLALWMVSDAAARSSWAACVASLVAMPIFGAMSAALYWLLR